MADEDSIGADLVRLIERDTTQSNFNEPYLPFCVNVPIDSRAELLLACILTTFFIHASTADEVRWLRNELGVSFAYRAPWKAAEPAESDTSHLINWTTKSDGLVANCYLQQRSGGLGNGSAAQLHESIESITESYLRNTRKRAARVQLVSSTAVFVDGYPMVQIVMDAEVVSLDLSYRLRTWSLVTSWKDYEIVFECGTAVIRPEFPEQAVIRVESAVRGVLRTLHFER